VNILGSSLGQYVALVAVLAVCGSACSSSVESSARSAQAVQSASSIEHKNIHLYLNRPSIYGQSRGQVIIVGGLADTGTSVASTVSGQPDRNGTYLKITLKHGTFLAAGPVHLDTRHLVTNKTLCYSGGPVPMALTLSRGTGAYAGIRGTLQATLMQATVYLKYKTGQYKGACNYSKVPLSGWFQNLTGHGQITLPVSPPQ
jgi:hypothetical protein